LDAAGSRRKLDDVVFSVPPGAGTPAESLAPLRGVRLIFVAGKGGVGKSTVASTLALRLARANANDPILLLSTDPAHSLGDALGQPLGDRPEAIRGGPANLRVREVDAAQALKSRRVRLEAALDEIGRAVGVGGIAGGERGAAALLDLAPPGIDELFGLVSLIDASEEFARVVIDTAPTGHALRLLETPDAAASWVRLLMQVLLKYRAIVRPGQLASELVDLSRSLRTLQERLRNPSDTVFIVVARAARVPAAETVRLAGRLRRLRLAPRLVVVNAMTLAPGRCPRCRANARVEQREAARLGRQALCRRGRCVIIHTPLAAPPMKGAAALEQWGATWRVVS
jgi:arsenite-transporting ATPase